MALKKYEDAAKTALIIARQEQDMGNYALAHSVVAETVRCLEEGDRREYPFEAAVRAVDSYQLSKKMVKAGDQVVPPGCSARGPERVQVPCSPGEHPHLYRYLLPTLRPQGVCLRVRCAVDET